MPTLKQMGRLRATTHHRHVDETVYVLRFANLASIGDFWNPNPWANRSMAYWLSSSLPRTVMPIVYNWRAWVRKGATVSWTDDQNETVHGNNACFSGVSRH